MLGGARCRLAGMYPAVPICPADLLRLLLFPMGQIGNSCCVALWGGGLIRTSHILVLALSVTQATTQQFTLPGGETRFMLLLQHFLAMQALLKA